jgi:hypothetical protein
MLTVATARARAAFVVGRQTTIPPGSPSCLRLRWPDRCATALVVTKLVRPATGAYRYEGVAGSLLPLGYGTLMLVATNATPFNADTTSTVVE